MVDNTTDYENLTVFTVNVTEEGESGLIANETIRNLTRNATCDAWADAQDVLFHLANLCFAVSFLAPSTYKYHVLFLRSIVALGNIFFFLWASLATCFYDVLGWNLGFLIANAAYVSYLAYKMYPVQFDPALEPYYTYLRPFKVGRTLFQEFTSVGEVVTLEKGAIYATEGRTPCKEKLSVLLSGRIKVTCKGIFLHCVELNQFLDSPEYEAYPPTSAETSNYQVTISAMEDSKLITWSPKAYHQFLQSCPFIDALLTNLMGKDITIKLYQLQEMLRHPPQPSSPRSSITEMRNNIAGNNNSPPTLNQTIEKLHRYSMSGSRKSVSLTSPRSPRSPRSSRFTIEHDELFNDKYDERLSPNNLPLPVPNQLQQQHHFYLQQQQLLHQLSQPGGSIQCSPSTGSFETTV